ncbi:MAG: tryptophan--tRNA ligase [Caldiserica bacterium]|jgi:tryptophanyl-tRNA synthetase|nr:tryptophan--tRNA ligase [Caldisericota bacterium]
MEEKVLKKRILTGDRASGNLHLGHYVGSIVNRLKLQEIYDCYYMIADLHALTTHYEDPDAVRESAKSIFVDYLSVGLDPFKSTLFIQSCVPEHSELYLVFQMLVTISRAQRIPTLKDKLEDLHIEEGLASLGLLGYPVLQAADILLYKADLVPVGEDQVSHIELTREIARRFNYLYGQTFPEPEAMLSEVSRLPGINGNKKMSKSLGNDISLSASREEVQEKVKAMVTDPAKIRKDDPGHPEICTVFAFHKAFNKENAPYIETACKNGRLGCVADKENLASVLNDLLEPIRTRRAELLRKPDYLRELLELGNEKARKVASATMAEVREKVRIGPLSF